jgi:hypothetical protein
MEHFEARDRLDMTWFYNAAQQAVRGEQDSDGNGRTDVWFDYAQGKLTQVKQDTNADGKPDLWENYDLAEALVRRARDLNFDGVPDQVEQPNR